MFHVLIYLREPNKYEQKSIYVKIPCQFLAVYSHKPFKSNTDFDYFYKLEPELTYKFVNFENENDDQEINDNEEEEITHVDILNTNETIDKNEIVLENATDLNLKNSKMPKLARPFPLSSNGVLGVNFSDIYNSSKQWNASGPNQNKFAEQVIPVRGYYRIQIFPDLVIEMTDDAETYDGLINNLDKIVENENEFLKPLNLIYLANLNNFNAYFGLNKTYNTSTKSLREKIVKSIATKVLQKNNKTKSVDPLLNLINTTITNINLTHESNDSLTSSLQDTLKNSLKTSLDKTGTQIKILELNSTQQNIIQNLTNQLNQTNLVDEEKMNSTATFNNKNYTQIYIGNVDSIYTLSSLKPFVGCISGVIFNNQLINLTEITENKYKDQLESGKILKGVKMLCTIKNCQNSGRCLDNWLVNKTICNCTNTSYTGDKCDDDLGSAFNSYNHLFYRLDPRKPRNLLEDQVTFELAFNFNYEDYFMEKNRYYHQEIEESNLHKHNTRLYNAEEQIKDKWYFDNRILLLIIYETRYILLYVNKDNSLILSDVDNKGNGNLIARISV